MFYKLTKMYFKFIIFIIFVFNLTVSSSFAKDNSLLLMITDKTCLICMVWEKQIGKIYPKTETANKFPLSRIEMNDFVNYNKHKIKKTNITPTFVFIRNNNEKGRIEGYTSPEMFWWQVDEIIRD